MCGAKFHYLYQKQKVKKILMLDADIVFIGPFLERLLPATAANDYVVSFEANDITNKEWVSKTYFNIEALQSAYPRYQYPGFFFNAGQLFLTTGVIDEKCLNEFFDPHNFPFWRNTKLFPLFDQSIYNYLLPTLHAEKKLKLGKDKFMIWAGSETVVQISLQDIREKSLQSGVIHWAGCLRFTPVSKMIRGDILEFFENFYYSKLKFGGAQKVFNKNILVIEYYLKQVYYKLKPSYWSKRIKNVIEREKLKYPGKPGFIVLRNRLGEIILTKLDRLIISLKKDSTFKSHKELFMCSLYPEKVLNIVISELKPKSVLDVGCGVGYSLNYYLSKMIDGWGVENSTMAISNSVVKERIIKYNLKKELNLNKKFDLVWCFEVIEHIHPDYEKNFLKTLTNHSDRILISAARPGQGGYGHFNEQRPEYWINKFGNLGYHLDEEFTAKVRATKENHAGNLLFFIKF
jgi:2-polyprenyl-3-methyl-5-hydroxy-6-metoxy-1,4-benzoquinol methylase